VAPPSSSVVSTISAVLKFAGTPIGSREQHRLLHDAEKLSRKFRLSEKRFWHVRVNAFSESEQWSNLRSMLENNRRPPIGYKPFARAAIRGNRPQSEILRYIDPVNIPEERYDLLCEASLWKEALSIAEGLRDARRVLNVKSLCNDPSLQLHADTIMARLA
jgi:vacuolar protein sorting-associated protein 16